VFDLLEETPLPLPAAAAVVPPARNGRKTHVSTILRWILTGAKGPDGRRVRLEARRIGGRWFTSREALERFSCALTPATDTPAPPAPRSSTASRRASERAAAELEKIGI
jgi:hypothetical protein